VGNHMTGMVFWKAGTLACSTALQVAAAQPCLLLVDTSTEVPRIYAADPTHTQPVLNLTVNDRRREVPLPRTLEAGRTVAVR